MKKLIAKLTAAALLLGSLSLPISAANEYPREFWALNDRYNAALESGDYYELAASAMETCRIIEGRAATPIEIQNSILSGRYYEAGNAYEMLGQYDLAADCFLRSIPYNAAMGYSDAVRIAASKAKVYKSSFELYRSSYDSESYFGAKHEKELGVLFGTNLDSPVYNRIPERSMVLIYQSFGETQLDYTKYLLAQAAADGLAVEYALNLPYEGWQLADVLNSKDYILSLIKMLEDTGAPIFLRFAAEMDTWSLAADPALYIEAFRFVSKLVHENSKNIAMVWSPTYATDFYTNVHDFYPGDEYVDWIGLSLYMITYHMGANTLDEKTRRINEASFFSGDAANPVLILDDFIKTYGDRKPFMISESGASHYFRNLGLDTTEWAVNHLKQLYGYVPMVYPQVKLIAHFDKVMSEEYCDFSLSENPTLTALYGELVKDGAFVRGGYSAEAEHTHKKLDSYFSVEQRYTEFSTYASYYGEDDLTAHYYVDGVYVGSAYELPYTFGIDLSAYSLGWHSLTIDICAADGRLLDYRTYSMSIEKPYDIVLVGQLLSLASKPITDGDLTLVPIAEVFASLGFKVNCDAQTGVCSINSAILNLKLTPGSRTMLLNGKQITLSDPVRMIGSVAYAPIGAIAEAVGCVAVSDSYNRVVSVNFAG